MSNALRPRERQVYSKRIKHFQEFPDLNRLLAALQFNDKPSAYVGGLRQLQLGNPLPFALIGDNPHEEGMETHSSILA